MKLATYQDGDAIRIGVVDVGKGLILDLAAAARRKGVDAAPFASMPFGSRRPCLFRARSATHRCLRCIFARAAR